MDKQQQAKLAALDLAIVALEHYRKDKKIWMSSEKNKMELDNKVNNAIRIVAAIKNGEQLPLPYRAKPSEAGKSSEL